MADLTVTATSVVKGPGVASTQINTSYTFAVTVTAGQAVYLNSSNQWALAKATTAVLAACQGIALNGGAVGQQAAVQMSGQINVGATLVLGETYMVSDAVAGNICPIADITAASGSFVTYLGQAITTSLLQLAINATGVAHA